MFSNYVCIIYFGTLHITIYTTTVQSVILYGSETWLLALREGHGRMVFHNGVQRASIWCIYEEIGSAAVVTSRNCIHEEIKSR
jgi:hypothetical protein